VPHVVDSDPAELRRLRVALERLRERVRMERCAVLAAEDEPTVLVPRTSARRCPFCVVWRAFRAAIVSSGMGMPRDSFVFGSRN
jgi:hypothetical protein